MEKRRNDEERRRDGLLAERIDLALKTSRAFDVKAAVTYLHLCKVSRVLIESFVERFPNQFRGTSAIDGGHRDRRDYSPRVEGFTLDRANANQQR